MAFPPYNFLISHLLYAINRLGGVYMLANGTYSMYDIMLKGANKVQGKIESIWRINGLNHDPPLGIHYIAPNFLEDNWHLDHTTQHFSNYRAAAMQQPYKEYGEGELVFGEKLFSASWWVESILQYELGYEYKGFEDKQSAYAYYKERKQDHDYFDVFIFKVKPSDITDFVPMTFTYPVQEIADKKYYNHIRRSKHRQKFIYWFCQYLNNLIYHEFKRSIEDETDFWWGLLCDFRDADYEIKQNKKNWVFHLYELLDIALTHMYDGGNTDLENYK